MVSRRGLLAGGAALALGSVLAARPWAAYPRPVRIERGTLTSAYWPGRTARWVVVGPVQPGPLVIALHSLGTNAEWFVETLDAPGVSARTGLTIAAVDGGATYWHPHENGVDTSAMVTKDFLPLLAEKGYDTSRFGLTGVSMGGYGAMRLAALLPRQRITGVAVVAPALRRSYWENRTLLFDDEETFDANNPFDHVAALRPLPVCIACGRDDDFYNACAAMANLLPRAVTLFDEGGHTTRYMAAHWGPVMQWLAFVSGSAPLRAA